MSDLDNKLETLRHLPSPPPSDAARRRALEAAMLAFDTEQQKSADTPQGENWYGRLRSIFHTMKGSWIMDTRVSIGLGTAAVALLLLPLGYQLYTSTALTPPSFEQREPAGETTPEFQASTTENESTTTVMSGGQSVRPAKPVELQQQPAPEVVVSEDRQRQEAPVDVVRVEPNGSAMMDQASNLGGVVSNQAQAKRAVPSMEADAVVMGAPPVVAGAPAPSATVETFASAAAPRVALPQAMPSGDEFTDFDESAVKVTAEEPVSTFSIDVDTASYSYVRRMLSDGYMPAPDAVRIEEMINYFDYGYAGPEDASTPFRATMQIYPTPWNQKTQLLQIGIKGYVPPVTEDKASNLVFLLDTSGSMDEPDKLPLLKRAFGLLVDQLGANDTVSIVTYAGSAGVALEPTKATDKAKILGAIETLWAGGSTAGAHGIELAYQLATQHKVTGGINRVILATDGDFNVGIDDPSELVDFIKQKRDQGIFLSVLGFGQGNYGDDTMQALAQNGNGNASYIDSFKEAQKVLVHEIGGTLETIAQDVKIQVEFNPAIVAEYRLIGYETRALNREDFNNDKVDAGEIGAGHTVTALYEITPAGSGAELVDPLRYGQQGSVAPAVPASDEIGFLKMRYKAPEGTTSQLIETPITPALEVATLAAASEDARWAAAVAAFAQKLKGSSYGGTMSYNEIKALAQGARGSDENGYRAEFIQLINSAQMADPGH